MPKVVLAIATIAWAIALSVLGLWKYAIYRADVDDGIFTQVLLSFGRGFSSTAEGGINHLLVHCSPILFVLVPLVRAVGDARALIVAQAVLSSLVVIPVYAIARRRTSAWASCAIAAISLCYPVLWAASFTDFHENAFVPVLAATLAWAIDARRVTPAILAAIALCCTKEDQFVLLGGVGVITAFAFGRDRAYRTIGAALFGIAALSAVLYFDVYHRLLNPTIPYLSLHFYDWSLKGSSPLGFAPALSPLRPLYLLMAFLPLAFLPLRSRLCLLAIPGFFEVLASHEAITISLGTHYVAAWLGYVLAAFAASAADLLAARKPLSRILVACAPVACVLVLLFADPMSRWYFLYRLPDAHDAELNATLAALPRGVTVGSDDPIFAHLANRRGASLEFHNQEYYVHDERQYNAQWADVDRPLVTAALREGSYRVVSARHGIVVIQRARRTGSML